MTQLDNGNIATIFITKDAKACFLFLTQPSQDLYLFIQCSITTMQLRQ